MKNLKDMPVTEKQRYKAFVTINNSVAKPIYTTLPSSGLCTYKSKVRFFIHCLPMSRFEY